MPNYVFARFVAYVGDKRPLSSIMTATHSRLDQCTLSTVYSCRGFRVFADDTTKEQAVDILNDLDWCLDLLEGMQTHRSVSDMTTNKV